jgi:hypothetical protein
MLPIPDDATTHLAVLPLHAELDGVVPDGDAVEFLAIVVEHFKCGAVAD